MTRPSLRILPLLTPFLLSACGGAGGASDGTAPAPSPAATAGASGGSDGPPPSPASVLEGVYTDAQAERGAAVWRDTCSECHGTREFRGDRFFLNYDGVTVGRFVDQLQRTMPDDAPGTLATGQYVDVTAYILRLNQFPTGAAELPERMELLDGIRIERPGAPR